MALMIMDERGITREETRWVVSHPEKVDGKGKCDEYRGHTEDGTREIIVRVAREPSPLVAVAVIEI